ncbi:MAG: hypothetical protein N4A49_14515 [Marinifilaceae bacterium]|jgi:DNA mismatch repair ATPase MutS|nr:hypothetical protein [Marinifilaceae bacterium]
MNKSELIDFYKTNISQLSQKLRKMKFNRNLYSFGKLIIFCSISYFFYRFLITENYSLLYVSFGLSIVFLVIFKLEQKLLSKLNINKELINIQQTEIDYKNNNFSSLKTGSEFLDSRHKYALDLDIFGENSIFQAINRTVSKAAYMLLAQNLLNSLNSKRSITNRQRAIDELSSKINFCHMLRAIGGNSNLINQDDKSIFKWVKSESNIKINIYYCICAVSILSYVLYLVGLIAYQIGLIFFFIQLSISIFHTKKINKIHANLSHYCKTTKIYADIFKLIEREKFSSELLLNLQADLINDKIASKEIKELNKILDSLDQRSNILVSIAANGLFMRDIFCANKLEKWKLANKDNLEKWINNIYEFELLMSFANYKFNHQEFNFPELIENETYIKALNLAHPMIDSEIVVKNNFEIDKDNKIVIITGANMAGKSTFLRAIGINYVLALTGSVVCAEKMEVKIANIFTSMRTTDNLAEGKSYFHAELLRLKQLKIELESHKNNFIILDEMLKGTNSLDKLNGSYKFLKKIIEFPVSGIVATHDLELSKLSDEMLDNFSNKCFEIEHINEKIKYDYKIKDGVSQNMNASILMKQMELI